jgi:hypothetical protein
MPNRSRADSGTRKWFALQAVLLGMSIGSGVGAPAVAFADAANSFAFESLCIRTEEKSRPKRGSKKSLSAFDKGTPPPSIALIRELNSSLT